MFSEWRVESEEWRVESEEWRCGCRRKRLLNEEIPVTRQ